MLLGHTTVMQNLITSHPVCRATASNDFCFNLADYLAVGLVVRPLFLCSCSPTAWRRRQNQSSLLLAPVCPTLGCVCPTLGCVPFAPMLPMNGPINGMLPLNDTVGWRRSTPKFSFSVKDVHPFVANADGVITHTVPLPLRCSTPLPFIHARCRRRRSRRSLARKMT